MLRCPWCNCSRTLNLIDRRLLKFWRICVWLCYWFLFLFLFKCSVLLPLRLFDLTICALFFKIWLNVFLTMSAKFFCVCVCVCLTFVSKLLWYLKVDCFGLPSLHRQILSMLRVARGILQKQKRLIGIFIFADLNTEFLLTIPSTRAILFGAILYNVVLRKWKETQNRCHRWDKRIIRTILIQQQQQQQQLLLLLQTRYLCKRLEL